MATLAEQRSLYDPDGVSERNIPNLNEGSSYTIGGGTNARPGGPSARSAYGQPQPIRTTAVQGNSGGLGGGGLGPSPHPVEPSPGPGVNPNIDPPSGPGTGPAGTPGTAPSSDSYPWDSGPPGQAGDTSPPGSAGDSETRPPGDVRSRHDDIPAPDINDPDNWAFGLEDMGNGSWRDPRSGIMYDRWGRKIRPSHTGPTRPGYYDPGDGGTWVTPGGDPGHNPGWGVNPIEWFAQNIQPMELHQSNITVDDMLLGPHEGQASENVTVGPMSQSQAYTAPGTNLSGLTGDNAASIDSGPDAQASGYTAHTQEVDPTHTASGQMTQILSQDSPLMQRARQEGILMAARRGLTNSSIAGGAALGAMVDRSQPLALANAQQYANQDLANQNAMNTAAQFNSNWENQMEQLNKSIRSTEATAEMTTGLEGEIAAAQIASAESQFNAQLQTQNEQFNANWANQAQTLQAELRQQNNQFNASQQNAIDMHIMQLNTALNEQYLRGTQALDLATIQGQFSSLIAQNQTAASMFAAHLASIGQIMSNHEISPATIASYVEIQQNLLQAGLQLLADMNNMTIPDDIFSDDIFVPDDAGPAGGGSTGPGADLVPGNSV